MNKADLIDALRKENGLSKDQAERIVNTVFNEMTKSLAEGGRVEIRGFCSFYVKEYKAYIGRNPKTKEAVSVAPKKLPSFKCGKELKERVDR